MATPPLRPKVMFVDDEPHILRSLQIMFEDEPDLDVLVSGSPRQAIATLKTGQVQVLVTDERMPELPGHQLLKHTSQIAPHTVRLMMSGYTDSQEALKTLQSGPIFRFLAKPFYPDQLIETVREAVNFALVKQLSWRSTAAVAEHSGPERSFHPVTEGTSGPSGLMARLQQASTKAQPVELYQLDPALLVQHAAPVTLLKQYLTQQSLLLSLRGHRLQLLANQLMPVLSLTEEERTQLTIACELHQLGELVLPQPVLWSAHQQWGYQRQWNAGVWGSLVAAKLLASVPSLLPAALTIQHQHEWFDGSGVPGGLRGDSIPLGARILAVLKAYVAVFDKLDYTERGAITGQVFKRLQPLAARQLDPHLLSALQAVLQTNTLGVDERAF